MTEAEKQVFMMLAEVWNKYLELPYEHISDQPEFCAGIHRLQEKVLARPARREMNK